MDDSQLTFVSSRHSENALSIMTPSSPHNKPTLDDIITTKTSPSQLNLCTYTAGEDQGRLASMAKEFGLAKGRRQKQQLRRKKHTFKPFLRNPSSLNLKEEDSIPYYDKQPSTLNEPIKSSNKHPPLRFVFTGYSLWLELEQVDIDDKGLGDLDRAMVDAADRFNLEGAIPSPHVTALYGINTIRDEEEMKRVFSEDVKEVLLDMAEKKRIQRQEEECNEDDVNGVIKLWPDLSATGIIVDTEFNGINGGTMDMAWAEVSLATSLEHEEHIDALHKLFYDRPSSTEEYVPRSSPWVPHLSLLYDNPGKSDLVLFYHKLLSSLFNFITCDNAHLPEGLGPNVSRTLVEEFMKEECPTLRCVLENTNSSDDIFSRAVTGIALWRTCGTMAEWKCLERFEFPTE